jgi:hypothetical protein
MCYGENGTVKLWQIILFHDANLKKIEWWENVRVSQVYYLKLGTHCIVVASIGRTLLIVVGE